MASVRRASSRRVLERALTRLWFETEPGPGARALLALLAPLECIVRWHARRQRARIEALGAPRVPVIVIGNLVAGGAGKTPLVAALAKALATQGHRPGLLVRGHGRTGSGAVLVQADTPIAVAGDEALVLARRTGLPVAVGSDRGAALALLLTTHPELDVVLSDDGLQHERLARSVELVVFDQRGVGNGRLLPAGPLREPAAHAMRMDALVISGDGPAPLVHPRIFRAGVRQLGFSRVDESVRALPAAELARRPEARAGIVAFAGVANPERFFAMLAGLGIDATPLELGDHEAMDRDELKQLAAGLILMTEKDAVKCRSFADHRCWFLEIEAIPEPALIDWLEESIHG